MSKTLTSNSTDLTLAYRLSGAFVGVALGVAAACVFVPGIFRDPPMPAGNA